MSKELIDGIWVVKCDWKGCNLGRDGEPAQFVDPNGGKDPNNHFQCGRHHGIIPQEEKPEFQLPEDHVLNKDVITKDKHKLEVADDD